MSGPVHTILIVDDEDDLRDAIAFDFRRKKFKVLTASCGNEALEILKKENVDIVLSDVRMPNGDGVQLLEKIKAINIFRPIVMFISGFADIALREAYGKGADAVFMKPFDRKVLYDAVQNVLQSPDQQYLRKSSRVGLELPVSLKFLGSNFSIQSTVRNLGRDGMFVLLGDKLPQNMESVEFSMEYTAQEKFEMAGQGIVRWIREEAGSPLPAGCGIEFIKLTPECMQSVVEMINLLKTKAAFLKRELP